MKIEGNINVTEFLKGFSITVWERLKLAARSSGIRFNETTLTQELIFQLYMLGRGILPIRIFESTDEKRNGNDMEFLVEIDDGVIKIPVQAKKITLSGQYSKLRHRSKSGYQVDLLVDYAKKIHGYPAYLFYNYYEEGDSNFLEEQMQTNLELWGCTLVSAKYIQKNVFKRSAPLSFPETHPNNGNPFFHLGEVATKGKKVKDFRIVFSDFDVSKVKLFKLKQVLNESNWNELTKSGSLGYIDAPNINFAAQVTTGAEIFRPGFRILITKEIQRTLQFLD